MRVVAHSAISGQASGTRRAVRFWGHDSAIEATFFVTEAALKSVQPDMRLDETGMLQTFDSD